MNFLKNLLLVFVLLVISVVLDGAHSHYDAAVDVLRSDQDFARAVQYLEVAVRESPRDGEYKQLLGTCYFKTGRSAEAIGELEAAIALLGWENSPSVIGNLLEALSAENRYDEAMEVSAKAAQTHPDSMQIVYNSATIRQRRGRYEEAVPLFLRVNALDPSFQEAYERAIDCLLELQMHGYAELGQIKAYTEEAINRFPQAHMFPYLMGVSLHKEGRLTEALEWYGRARQMRPEYLPNLANIGAIYQGMGDVNNALEVYSQLLPLMPADAGIRNNYGSLLGAMGRRDEGLYWLLEAYRLNPQFSNVNINLGSYYAEEGDPAQAAYYLLQAIPYTDKPNALRIRVATALSPVSPSWDHMVRERASFEVSVLALIHEASSSSSSSSSSLSTLHLEGGMFPLTSDLDLVHFYIVYHGLCDRYVQELMARLYQLYIQDLQYIAPHLLLLPSRSTPLDPNNIASAEDTLSGAAMESPPDATTGGARKTRIGFLSKFMGLFEPHGQLLDGVMASLHRDRFVVVALPVVRTDGKPLSPTIAAACDEVHEVPLSHHEARRLVGGLELDILVFADTLSEPIAHFMAQARIATYQLAFWGNPVTSGSPHIDYFVSADAMEHPYRTRMHGCEVVEGAANDDNEDNGRSEQQHFDSSSSTSGDPYTEQVVLLGGQGIWYYRPRPAHEDLLASDFHGYRDSHSMQQQMQSTYDRSSFGLQAHWFVLLCPQSAFKMHPLFDRVLARILHDTPSHVHVVVTGGHRGSWTRAYSQRLYQALDTYAESRVVGLSTDDAAEARSLGHRLHIVPRVSSEKFQSLLSIAEVVLHPFPFDGSKTSADAVLAGVPFVTLPSEQLKGRMGVQYLRTMGLPQLAAHNASHYVDIAVRLATDPVFYTRTQALVRQRSHLIWEDIQVLHEWSSFLDRLHGSMDHATAAVDGDYTLSSEGEGRAGSLEAFIKARVGAAWLAPGLLPSRGDTETDTNTSVKAQMMMHREREAHRAAFDAAFGDESYLLDADGSVCLESHVDFPALNSSDKGTSEPRIFHNWATAVGMGAEEYRDSDRMLGARWRQAQPATVVRLPLPVLMTETPPLPLLLEKYPPSGQNTNQDKSLLHIVAVPPPQRSPQEQVVQTRMRMTGGAAHSNSLTQSERGAMRAAQESVWLAGRQGRLKDALELSERLLESYYGELADSSMHHTEHGCLHYLNGQYQEAWEHCERGVMLDKNNTVALICSGVAAIYLRREWEAVQALTAAVARKEAEARGEAPVMASRIFSASDQSIRFNLLTALQQFGRPDQCVEVLSAMLPSPDLTGSLSRGRQLALTITLSFVQWSPRGLQVVRELGSKLKNLQIQGDSSINSDGDALVEAVETTQKHLGYVLNIAVECMSADEESQQDMKWALNQQYRLLDSVSGPQTPHSGRKRRERMATAAAGVSDDNNSEKIVLMTQVYAPSAATAREAMVAALLENLSNPRIHEIVLFTEVEGGTSTGAARGLLRALVREFFLSAGGVGRARRDWALWASWAPEPPQATLSAEAVANTARYEAWVQSVLLPAALGSLDGPRLHLVPLGGRLTFGVALKLANERFAGRVVVLANSDIAFDGSLAALGPLESLDLSATSLALTKWTEVTEEQAAATSLEEGRAEVGKSKSESGSGSGQRLISRVTRSDSQDAWVVRAPVPAPLVAFANSVVVGTTRCDNVMAHALWEHGRAPVNPSTTVHAIERRGARGGSDGALYPMEGAAFGPTRDVLLSDWGADSFPRDAVNK